MTWYLGITTTKKIVPLPGEERERGEFAVLKQMEAKGIEAFVPRKIEFVRQGKRRYPDPVASPYMPGYVFFNAAPEQFLPALDCRGMSRTVVALRKGDLRGERRETVLVDDASAKGGKRAVAGGKMVKSGQGILDFREYAAEKEAEARRIIERNDRAAMVQFEPGDPMKILSGPFLEFVATFVRMVDRDFDGHPMVEGEVTIFGRATRIQLDPLDLKKANA